MASAIIAATAALTGVVLAQLIGWMQRRGDERRRRRSAIAAAVAPTLSLVIEAIAQIQRGRRAGTPWHQQAAWRDLREQTWPAVRILLLTQAADEPASRTPSFYGLTLELQDLLTAEERDFDAAMLAWDRVREHALALRDRHP